MTLADRFLDRYSPCSQKSYGEYREGLPEPAKTVKRAPDTETVEAHLQGKIGLGLVPLDGELSRWGAIDIDNHSGDSEINLKELASSFKHFPGIVVTRSKSGGAHVYFFLKEAVSGRQIRSTIHQVAMAVGLEGNEVFPKQNKIRADGWGNWINLPYFGGDDTNRYGVKANGERMTLAEFLDRPRTTPAEIESLVERMHIGAPPCIQHLLTDPPAQGHRNMALFSLAVFFKRSDPGNWQEKTTDYATRRMDPPLPLREVRNVIRSVGRKDYTYRCTEAPLIDLCDKAGCKLARHGLTIEEQNQHGDPVGVVSLTKYLTEPPVWDLKTELGDVRLSTKALLSHALVREAIAERYLKIVPKMKSEEWHAILSDLMAQCAICDVPDDSTSTGLVWNALVEFTLVAVSENESTSVDEDDAKWQGGIPIKKDKEIHFQGARFVAWLRRTKRAEGMSPSGIYMALKERGIKQNRVRIGGKIRRSWSFPADQVRESMPVYHEAEEEF